MSKPTILLFVGAYHDWACLASFVELFQKAGFPVVGETLRTVDSTLGLSADVEMMTGHVEKLVEHEGKDVVTIFHSYAGIPGGAAISGMSRSTRSVAGKAGGVVGVIWVASFIPHTGKSLIDLVGGETADWTTLDFDAGVARVTGDAVDAFYGDVPAEETAKLVPMLKPHSLQSFADPAPAQGWEEYDGERAYIVCEKDHAIPTPSQDAMIEGSGKPWAVKRIDSDHTPFASHSEELVGIVQEVIGGFAGQRLPN